MSPTPSHHGYQASSPPPRAPSQATLPLCISLGTVWLPMQTWPEQSRRGLLGVLVHPAQLLAPPASSRGSSGAANAEDF